MRQKVPCPGCGPNDVSGNNLLLFNDDPSRGYCHHCRKSYAASGVERVKRKDSDEKLELHSAKQLPIKALVHKPISLETATRYGVKTAIDTETGEAEKVLYPYYDQDGNITGYKIRTLPKEFSIIGKVKGLFGQFQCKQSAHLLVITEGEDDALAAYEMLKQKGKNYNVVSIPNGANLEGIVDNAVRAELEFITKHKLVVLCFDNDKPGQATANGLAELICSQTRVKILKLPRKDAGQMLIEGMADEFEKQFYTQDYHPEQVVRGSEISLESLRTAKEEGYELPYPELQKKLHGLRKGEITTFCAGSGIGKSTVTRELAYHLVEHHNLKVATIALETPVEDAARAMIAIDLNVPLHKLMFNPNCVSEEDYERSYNKLLKSNRTSYFKHWGSIESSALIRKLHYLVKALGIDFLVLDHANMVVAGDDVDERKSLDMLMEGLTKLVVETGVGVLLVVHLKRVTGKNYNTGDEIELVDLRGSAGLEQMSWNVVGLERNQQDDNKKDYSRIRVLKNRLFGFTGKADTLQYHHDTGRLLTANLEY